jgi:hypothetical protein
MVLEPLPRRYRHVNFTFQGDLPHAGRFWLPLHQNPFFGSLTPLFSMGRKAGFCGPDPFSTSLGVRQRFCLTIRIDVGYTVSMKRKVAFYLNVEQLEKLRAIHRELGVPVSESIRRAIDLYLKQGQKKK